MSDRKPADVHDRQRYHFQLNSLNVNQAPEPAGNQHTAPTAPHNDPFQHLPAFTPGRLSSLPSREATVRPIIYIAGGKVLP